MLIPALRCVNCFLPFASGNPGGIVAGDFDQDGKPDIGIISRSFGGHDSLFVLYNIGGLNATTSVANQKAVQTPQGFVVSQNYSNPFNPSTRIEYVIPSDSHVRATVYNIIGEEIATLVDQDEGAGKHTAVWDGRSSHGALVSSGVYFYRIEERETATHRLVSSVKKKLLMK